MHTCTKTTALLAALVVINLNLNAAIAADTPAAPLFGSADWKASPTDPVGFCGQQNNNWYPGATPPLEWWDGTPAKVKTRQAVPFYPGEFDKEIDADGFADSKSKNILWKQPVPGSGDSLPVAIRCKDGVARVITLSSPHYVTCWDADTGKVLWQDELKLMTLPVLGDDRKTVGPVPDPAQAAVAQDLYERMLAYTHVRLAATAFTRDFKDPSKYQWTARKPLLQHSIEVLEKWKTELAANHPDILPSLETEQALLRDCLANKPQAERTAARGRIFSGGYSGAAVGVDAKTVELMSYAMKKLHLRPGHFVNGWGAFLTDTMATPVSDGEVVCVMFGPGQVATYDLATGKRLWAWRDPLMDFGEVHHISSPLLWKDLMIFKAPAGNKGKNPDHHMTQMAVDKRTGAVRWSVPLPGSRNFGTWMSPVLFKLGERAVVISNTGLVLDPETGTTLAQLPEAAVTGNKGGWQNGFLLAIGDRVARTLHGGGGSTSVWPMRFHGDKLEVDSGFCFRDGTDGGPFTAGPSFFIVAGVVYDVFTGKELTKPSISGFTTLVGDWLISAPGNNLDVEMRREDLMRVLDFTVVDMSDPTSPRTLSRRNRLGGRQLPADIADKYFPEFKKPELKGPGLGGYMGFPGYFGHRLGGLTAFGNRLYIRSQTHLYCIGPAVLGAASDDPKIVAAIKAGQDIAKYLDCDSAQYRYEAVKRIRGQESGGRSQELNGKLEALAKSDPYEEIRAEALRVLGLETGKPGFAVLKQAITNEIVASNDSNTHVGLGDTVHTLRVLGKDAEPVLVALLTDADSKVRRTGAAAAGLRPTGSAAVRDALLAAAADRTGNHAIAATEVLSNWPADPAVTALFTKIVDDPKDGGFHRPAVRYLMRVLPDDQKNAMLAKACKGWNGQNNIATLLERGAYDTIKTVVTETKDRIQSGIIHNLCETAGRSDKPEHRKFAAEMVILALQNPPADLYALGGIANAATFLGVDAAPVLPALKALKPDYMKDAAKSVAEAIAAIEAKVEAGKK